MVNSKKLFEAQVEKADTFLTNVGANGVLDPKKANEFFLKMEEASVLHQFSRVEILDRKEMILPNLAFQSRVIRPGIEGVAQTESQRYRPTFSSTTITTKKLKAVVGMSEEVLEDNVEQEALYNKIMEGMSKRIAFDNDDLVMNGDITAGDAVYALFDGALDRAGHSLNAGGVDLSPTVLKNTLGEMPAKHRHNMADLAFYISPMSEINYRQDLSSRATGLGDEYLEGERRVRYMGMPLVKTPALLESGTTSALLTYPKNLIIGYYKEIRFNKVIDYMAGMVYIVATYWTGFNYEDNDAVVKTTNLTF